MANKLEIIAKANGKTSAPFYRDLPDLNVSMSDTLFSTINENMDIVNALFEETPTSRILNKLDGSTLLAQEPYSGGSPEHFHGTYTYHFKDDIQPVSYKINGQTPEQWRRYQGDGMSISLSLNGDLSWSGNCPSSETFRSTTVTIEYTWADGTIETDTCTLECWSAVCFARGTLVATPTGYKTVETLQEGDQVYACNIDGDEQPVVDTITTMHLENGSVDVCKITLSDGNTIRVTSTHGLYTDLGWRCCYPTQYSSTQNQLMIGDMLTTKDGTKVSVVSIERDITPQPIYHFTLTEQYSMYVTDNEKYSPIIAEHNYSIQTDTATFVSYAN